MSRDIYDHPALYDALFPIGAHLPFYSGVSERSGSVLELACGTGLLTVPLASRGTRVIGLDLSPTMLGAARERASVAKVSVDFVEGDVRTFAFDRRFDTIIVARNSLLHLNTNEDLLAALRGIVRHLAPDGVFAFDIFNPDVRILARPAGTRFPVVEVETDRFGAVRVESEHDYDAAAQVDRSALFISTADTPDKWVVPVGMRSIFPQELPLLLASAGLELVERFGDVTREPFERRSPRQACICRARRGVMN